MLNETNTTITLIRLDRSSVNTMNKQLQLHNFN